MGRHATDPEANATLDLFYGKFTLGQLDRFMKTSRIPAARFGFELAIVIVLLAMSVSAESALRIEKALCGAKGSWRDVTPFMKSKVQGDTLSAKISQPFREIGGDPAPG